MPETSFKALQKDFHQDADKKRFYSRLANPYIKHKEAALFGRLGNLDGKLVLEVGCGEGNNELYLRELNPGIRYVGVDFSHRKAAFARSLDTQGDYVQGDALDLPVSPGCADLVFIRDVLHHLDGHRREVVLEALSAVRPGGRLVVVEGNVKKLTNMIFCLLVPAERGMKNSTPEKFSAMCRDLGATRIEFIEPFFLIRAINYFLGWPKPGVGRFLARLVYGAARGLENLFAPLAGKRNTAYMMAFFEDVGTGKQAQTAGK